jgi:hypothetical protein
MCFLSGGIFPPLHFAFFQWFMYPCYRALARCSGVHFLNNSDAGRLDYAALALGSSPSESQCCATVFTLAIFPPVDDEHRHQARAALGLSSSAKVVGRRVSPFAGETAGALDRHGCTLIQRRCGDAVFLVCGVGPLRSRCDGSLRRKAWKGAYSSSVLEATLRTVLAASDLVLQTSLQEGTPNVLLEALACGDSGVTTPAFGAVEAVDDGVSGRVVAGSASAAGRSRAVDARDESALARARALALPFIEARFGFDRMIRDTLAAYATRGCELGG